MWATLMCSAFNNILFLFLPGDDIFPIGSYSVLFPAFLNTKCLTNMEVFLENVLITFFSLLPPSISSS